MQLAARDPVLFAEIAEKFPGKQPNEDLLRNYLARKGFAPAALSAVISAYRETSDMVERENADYGSSVGLAQEPEIQMHPQPIQSRSTMPLAMGVNIPQAIVSPTDERSIGRYDYEGGAYVRISASGDIDTEEALDMVETLIELKRAELARKTKLANSASRSSTAQPQNENEEET